MNLFLDAINDMVKKEGAKNMKLLTTKKLMRDSYNRIISIGYGDAQYLLHYKIYKIPFAYSRRVEGWACDYYDVDGVLISTGYSPLNEKNMRRDNVLLCDYNQQARIILLDNDLSLAEKRSLIDDLLDSYIHQVKTF